MSVSAPVTEIAVLTLKPDTTIEDVSSPAGQIFKQMLKTIRSQRGFQRQYWGRQLENANHLVLSIDWDSFSSHKSWVQSPSYAEYLAEISPLLDLSAGPGRNGAPNIIHLNYMPHPPDHPRSAPVTELAFFALASSAPESAKSALEDKVLNLAQTCVVKSSHPGTGTTDGGRGCGGVEAEIGVRATSFATGWVLEDMDHHAGTAGKATSLGLMLGWESKEAHLQAKESDAFRRAVQPVRDAALPAEPGRGMYHVAFARD